MVCNRMGWDKHIWMRRYQISIHGNVIRIGTRCNKE